MKKAIILLLSVSILFSVAGLSASAVDDITVTVNGETVVFDQQPIIVDGRTLVPIRAVCEKIGATVDWDSTSETVTISKNTIVLKLTIGSSILQSSKGRDELEVPPQIHNGRTLLPIRAVVEALGCDVDWDNDTRTVIINNDGSIAVSLANTQVRVISNWAGISPIQQFPYKDQGIAYAYIENNYLVITTHLNTFRTEMKYPILGDVISDDDGNFYVIWGKENETDNASVETAFISKYSSDGTFVKTTGFVGTSSPWGNTDSAKTQIPFHHGNCVSVIADGILVNYHGKKRYDGHQSDTAIAVKIADMSVYDLPNNTYSGHSFNQSVIYCEKTLGFLFASHGDAYARGFRVNSINGRYGVENEILFHFYMEANANYNMYIVNKTFAQLGNLAETSKGVAMVGASAKSISEAAKAENQNLFVQIFDPRASEVSATMFIGGETRRGFTATDINDSSNQPLTQITDYGVHWLTDYTDWDVICPQVATADDRLVIIWGTTIGENYYMVLSASGEVITSATALEGLTLNSYERPVYCDGTISWVAVNNGRLLVQEFSIN